VTQVACQRVEEGGVEFELLSGLSEADRREVMIAARRRKFGRREVIFHEGDPGESIHLIASGHVGLRITTPRGDVAMVRILGPGEFFGELALLSVGPRSATALALEGAETLSVSRAGFHELRSRFPAASEVLVNALAMEVRRLAAAHVEVMYLSAEQRVFRRLATAASSFGETAPIRVPLTQDELAQLAGTTRPTVNRLLDEAEQAGAVSLGRGRIDVLDLGWLVAKGR
jgi:CRP-like cAMP-binding protein